MHYNSVASFNSSESWVILSTIEENIKRKIDNVGIPLYVWDLKIYRGILTGFNKAFIISGRKRAEIISEDPKSAEIIRPIFRGRDIKRYEANFADLWLIVMHNGIKSESIPRIDADKYPAIKAHLDNYYTELAQRHDKGDTPYNLRNCAYMDDFSKQKIAWGNLCLSSQFALIEEEFFINAPSPMIVPGSKYLLAVLNSHLGDWYIRQLGVTRNGGYFEYKPMFVEQLPIPILTKEEEEPFNNAVDRLMYAKQNDLECETVNSKIDHMVYLLYGLNKEEVDYLESKK
ncbi:MAG: TaqI-like C-terminal specificity domain-containing protein [Bacillota bacterium]|nr:TaqI-like C-terminal specificity domain-containing protein [Bacillota bacterium]